MGFSLECLKTGKDDICLSEGRDSQNSGESRVLLLHQAHDITVMPVSKYLVANTEHDAMHLAHHGNFVVHLY